ncbi:MAG: FixH family protein [Steroidobacteraceae bacterium]
MAIGIATRLTLLAMLCGTITACNREPASGLKAVASPAGNEFSISFKVDPDPPRAGENKLEVSLKQAGAPVADATVTAVFYMPAMPSMNMPEMRSSFPLISVGDGIYRGNGNLIMSGTWNVTVTASREAGQLGSSKYTVIAK